MSGLLPLSRPHIRNMPAKKLIKKPTIAVPLFMIVSQSSHVPCPASASASCYEMVLAEKRSRAARARRGSDVDEPRDAQVTSRLVLKFRRARAQTRGGR